LVYSSERGHRKSREKKNKLFEGLHVPCIAMVSIINKSADHKYLNQLNEEELTVELVNRLFDLFEQYVKFLHNELSNIFSRASPEQSREIINRVIKRLTSFRN